MGDVVLKYAGKTLDANKRMILVDILTTDMINNYDRYLIFYIVTNVF